MRSAASGAGGGERSANAIQSSVPAPTAAPSTESSERPIACRRRTCAEAVAAGSCHSSAGTLAACATCARGPPATLVYETWQGGETIPLEGPGPAANKGVLCVCSVPLAGAGTTCCGGGGSGAGTGSAIDRACRSSVDSSCAPPISAQHRKRRPSSPGNICAQATENARVRVGIRSDFKIDCTATAEIF